MRDSIIVEENINNNDSRLPTYTAFLDDKSVFNVVNHPSLMRNAYHKGIMGAVWNLINSPHTDARSVIKKDGRFSLEFDIKQVVRVGILSTDLCKVYENQLLDRLDGIYQGAKIREHQLVQTM